MNQQPSQSTGTKEDGGGSMKLLLVILFTVIVLGGAYVLYNKYGKTPVPVTASPSPTLTVKTSPSALTSETADWGTFSDGAYTFKYPADWEVEKTIPTTGSYKSVVTYRPKSMGEDHVGAISLSTETISEAVERLNDQSLSNSTLESQTNVTFAGTETIKLVFVNNKKPSIKPVIYFVNNDPLYIISGEGTTEGITNNTVKQIIATFQFTN